MDIRGVTWGSRFGGMEGGGNGGTQPSPMWQCRFIPALKQIGQFRVVRKSAGQPHLAEFVASLHQKT